MSKRPIPGRCGSKRKGSSEYCGSWPVKGKNRCRLHGGTQEGKLPVNTINGKRSRGAAYPHLSKVHQDELVAAMHDPDLLDVRRGVALGQLVIQNTPLIPSEQALERSAARSNLRGMNLGEASAEVIDKVMEVDPADIELERIKHADRSLQIIERFHRRQVDAVKQIEVGRLMRQAVLPMMQEMGLRVGRLVHQYVPEDDRERFIATFRTECIKIVAELSAMRETK